MSELSNLVELLGADAALTLMEHHGGTRLAVPKEIPPEHELRVALGDEATRLLKMYYGGSTLLVPMARAWRAKIYHQRKLTYREMARKLGCTETAAYGYIKAAKADERQMALFEEERK